MTDNADDNHRALMGRALALAAMTPTDGSHGPFGAVVVHSGQVIGEGSNRVVANHDPTAHAEVMAIRAAAMHLGRHHLDDCVLYASCQPCPMCLAAIYWARIPTVYYAATRDDAQAAGFDDQRIQQYLCESACDGPECIQLDHPAARTALLAWVNNPQRRGY